MHGIEERKVYVNGAESKASTASLTGSEERRAETQRPRHHEGWRTGKPEEDPDKIKKWGRVSARPSDRTGCCA